MISTAEVSSCVDCGVSIIGEEERCVAYRAAHEEDVMPVRTLSPGQILLAWFVAAQVIFVALALLVLAERGCQ